MGCLQRGVGSMSQFFGGNTTGQCMAWLHGARLGLGGTVRSGLAWAVYSGMSFSWEFISVATPRGWACNGMTRRAMPRNGLVGTAREGIGRARHRADRRGKVRIGMGCLQRGGRSLSVYSGGNTKRQGLHVHAMARRREVGYAKARRGKARAANAAGSGFNEPVLRCKRCIIQTKGKHHEDNRCSTFG